jgi:hypothetical protein
MKIKKMIWINQILMTKTKTQSFVSRRVIRSLKEKKFKCLSFGQNQSLDLLGKNMFLLESQEKI